MERRRVAIVWITPQSRAATASPPASRQSIFTEHTRGRLTPTPRGMTDSPSVNVPCLVDALARVARRHRVARKLVIAPNMAAGRELLRRLALRDGGWIGFEVSTPERLAKLLALPGLEAEGLALLDSFEHQALVDEAIDRSLSGEKGSLADLAEGTGFRTRVHGAVTALRSAGVTPEDVESSHFGQWDKKLFLMRVLRRYERLLTERHKADAADVFRLALTALDEAGTVFPPSVDAESVSLMPGLGIRGLQGRFVSEVGARGAKLLRTDPVIGLDVPERILWGRTGPHSPGSKLFAVDRDTEAGDEGEDGAAGSLSIELFRASSIDAELREVLRRALEAGHGWDDVEIIATDPATYGSALHALSRRLDIGVTYAVGLPIARTRTGRVVAAYLDWIEEGFQAHVIRRLLEAGDLRPRGRNGGPSPAALARRFRSLRVGWGRKRYRSQIREALAGVEAMERPPREPEESFLKRRERAREELGALRSLLFPALKETPNVPDRMGQGGSPVSPAQLARGLEAFLERVPRGRGPDRSAREEVARILERINGTLHRRTEFRSAVSVLRNHLDIRVRPDLFGDEPDGSGAPWASMGGALHLTDLEHGGYSGRTAVFIVGLDADALPGGDVQDPVLLDSDRRVLGPDLPTAAELSREKTFRFAALFARLRGTVTLSHCAWDATEARTLGPSNLMLQALRTSRGDPDLTFEDLHSALGRVINAVPPAGRTAIDGEDWWMTALGSQGVMRSGVDAVRASFPALDAGLSAREARDTGPPGPLHGVITSRPEFDPRLDERRVLSASRLENLGACPLRYLHDTVLRIRLPDDPELDPDAWLDARARGSLLHAVFDDALRRAADEGVRLEERAFEEMASEVLEAGINRLRLEIPSPGEGTLARETAALREDVRSFIRMVREQAPDTMALELRFGLADDEPVSLELAGGALRLRGAIDRVDRDLAGLHVIDYKTGTPFGHGKDTFNGGRRLQHGIYAHAAESRLSLEVVDGQYHFPTRRGQNQSFSYDRLKLASMPELLDTMLDGVAAGHFVPTDSADDCKFCDFAEICRVSKGDFGRIDSPMAEWSEQLISVGLWPAFAQLKKSRGWEE